MIIRPLQSTFGLSLIVDGAVIGHVDIPIGSHATEEWYTLRSTIESNNDVQVRIAIRAGILFFKK